MTSRYQKSYVLPPEFPKYLKEFARAVLREQPGNVYEFGAQFFAELADRVKQDKKARKEQEKMEKKCKKAEKKLQEKITQALGLVEEQGIKALTVSELHTLLENEGDSLRVVDVREADEIGDFGGMLPQSFHCPAADIDAVADPHGENHDPELFAPGVPLIVVAKEPNSAALVIASLVELGYQPENVFYLGYVFQCFVPNFVIN
jgi:hypothetical protein